MGKKYFIFDLDNTLVKTNRANNKSYEEAIKAITGMGIEYRYKKPRFTRIDLSLALPYLSPSQITEIVKLKEDFYIRHLQETVLKVQLVKCLKLLKDYGEETILLTECRKTRAQQICNYYALEQFLSRQYYLEDYNGIGKYQYLKTLNIPLNPVVLFENEKAEIRKAKRFGIPKNQIITIKF